MDSEFANAVELSYECAPLLESLKEYSEKDIAWLLVMLLCR